MDNEKKYNELVGKIKKAYLYAQTDSTKAVLEDILPELRESEDEKIRKGLLKMFNHYVRNNIELNEYDLDKDMVLAWLEKQKEFVSADFDDVWKTADCDELTAPLEKYSKDAIKKMCHAWYDKGIELERKRCLEKQGEQILANSAKTGKDEQKSADKDKPKFKVGDKIRRKTPSSFDTDMKVARIDKDYYICNHIGKFSSEVVPFSKESSYELIEQMPSWSEEDEEELQIVIDTLVKAGQHDSANWLKSLKERVQPKKEWSEDDETTRKALINLVEMYYDSYINKSEKNRLLSWLKSLKPQTRWKPSDEQVNTLEQWLKDNQYKGDARYCYPIFESLYQDLKKLKG